LKTFLLAIIFVLSTAPLSAREGGGWSGNGGGFHQASDNIWFLGSAKINYCIERAADYPLKQQELSSLVKKGLKSWKDFFKKYDLLENKITGGFGHPRMNGLSFSDSINRGLNFNFSEVNCTGEEPLKFFFGVQNKIIETYRRLHHEHPYGLAIRKEYDHQKFNNSGLVWISNFSPVKDKISHTLLHELGHIFGMKHNSVFVMDQDMALMLSKKARIKSEFLGKVESDAWVYRFQKDRPLILTSRRGRRERDQRANSRCADITFAPNKLLPRAFHRAFGFSKRDCHRVTLTLTGTSGIFRKGQKLFDLLITELKSGKVVTLKGSFRASKGARPEFQGPGLFTSYKSLMRPGKSSWHRLTLDKELPDAPLTGVFNYGGIQLASKMTSYKGTVLEVFLPGSARWWTLKTIFNQ
jgi:hypothetical protein